MQGQGSMMKGGSSYSNINAVSLQERNITVVVTAVQCGMLLTSMLTTTCLYLLPKELLEELPNFPASRDPSLLQCPILEGFCQVSGHPA